MLDFGFLDFAENGIGDLAALRHNLLAIGAVDGMRQLHADEAVVDKLRIYQMVLQKEVMTVDSRTLMSIRVVLLYLHIIIVTF